VRTVVLVGHLGGAFWNHFERWHQHHRSVAQPLDAWSEEVITELASAQGARACFPSNGPPFWPFQAWAVQAEAAAVRVSPLKLLIHKDAGLWHAYRGAILLPDVLDESLSGSNAETVLIDARDDLKSACGKCIAKPCLSACPVDAFAYDEFAAARCSEHIAGTAGKVCVSAGCVARSACPAAPQYRYGQAQSQFHMRAFMRSRLSDREV